MNSIKVLVVDDDEVMRKLLCEVLGKEGYRVLSAASGEEAMSLLQCEAFSVIISDIRMLKLSGMEVLRQVKRAEKRTAVILMTGFGSMDGAIEAIREGAFDYISKPFKMDELKAVVMRAVQHWGSINSRGANGLGTLNSTYASSKAVIGKSPKIVEVYKTLARAALSSSHVLVSGESGTGKELIAHAIHDNSQRREKRLVSVNCGSSAEHMLEAELFGHDKQGALEEAHGGTLFLDEIDDLTPALQIKLLRVIQDKEVRRTGVLEVGQADVKIIAATNRDLETLVKGGKFREDLYYRLKVISIEIPPLRERIEDLSELVEFFLAKYARHNKKTVSHVSEEAMALLRVYSWPGNIRELEHAIEHAVAMSRTAILFPEDFPPEIGRKLLSDAPANAATVLSFSSLEEMERAHIAKILQEVQFNKSRASEVLGIDRATLYRKAQRYGIDLRGK
jgi:two-component system, NtrC family, response regulator AtoC